jgi:predicted GNAT superfamily acetyltransferase
MSQHAYDLPRHQPVTPSREIGVDRVELRPIETHAEFAACVELQADIWGAEFGDRVPASLLKVAAHIGGLTIGAFGPDGSLIGFVFGLTGVKGDEIVHWSHMLGVRVGAREMGIGRRLKEFQRATLAARGIRYTYWTFDPLQAKNAHLNFNRLGVRIVDYVVDMYGTTTSPLHYGLATDRLIVVWSNMREAENGARGADISPAPVNVPVMTRAPQPGDVVLDTASRPDVALIEVPIDLQAVFADSPADGLAWRDATRRNFEWALSNGYTVNSLRRDADARRAFYVVTRESETPAPSNARTH